MSITVFSDIFVKRYVKDPRTIVLCVISANADISTSDALQMAMTIDPEGTRTLGVITKVNSNCHNCIFYVEYFARLTLWTEALMQRICFLVMTYH